MKKAQFLEQGHLGPTCIKGFTQGKRGNRCDFTFCCGSFAQDFTQSLSAAVLSAYCYRCISRFLTSCSKSSSAAVLPKVHLSIYVANANLSFATLFLGKPPIFFEIRYQS